MIVNYVSVYDVIEAEQGGPSKGVGNVIDSDGKGPTVSTERFTMITPQI